MMRAMAFGVRKIQKRMVRGTYQKNTRDNVNRKRRRQAPAIEWKQEGQDDCHRRKKKPHDRAGHSNLYGLPKVEGIHVHGLPDKQQFDYKPCTHGNKRGDAPTAHPRYGIWPAHFWQDSRLAPQCGAKEIRRTRVRRLC
jgi:hypothetical protein